MYDNRHTDMDDYLTDFGEQNALILNEACEGDVEPKPNSRVFRSECCLAMKRRRIIVTAVFGVLLIVSLVISLAIVASSKSKVKDEVLCFTPECIHAASAILKSLDQEIDPCVNFYNFTCGGYLASTPIPDGRIRVNPSAELKNDFRNQLKSLLEEPGSPDQPRHFQLVKTLYKTCMNTSALEKAGLEPLQKILKEFGNWPLLEGDKWKEEHFNWQQSVWTAGKLGYRTDQFIDFRIDVAWLDSNRYSLTLDRPVLGRDRDYSTEGVYLWTENEYVDLYKKYMTDIMTMFGADGNEVTEQISEITRFEIALQHIPSVGGESRLEKNITLEEMNSRYPSVNWIEYMNNLLPSSIRVDADEVIQVNAPKFISELESLLRRTSKRVQANYVVWRIVAESIKYLSKNVRERETAFHFSLTPTALSNSDPRWKHCLNIIYDSSLSHSLNALYLRRYFNEDAKKDTDEIVAGIREELIKILKKADWMDKTTKDKAVEKAESIGGLVGHTVELLDDKVLEKFYSRVKLSADNFLGNILELRNIRAGFKFELLRKPINKTAWFSHDFSTLVDTLYIPNENNIVIPAVVLQGVFFDSRRPRYMNYGAIGSVIGHEITHSFDTAGKQYDKNGNLVDWWTPETTKKYLKKAQCIIDQYSNYTVESVGKKVDGAKTVDENMADNGGYLKAYLAYKNWVKKNGPEPKLPGLNYTQEQMFWISAGSISCRRYRPDSLKSEFEPSNPHSPKRFRVIGSFSNLKEFAADFNCPVGSYMNPIHKCSLL